MGTEKCIVLIVTNKSNYLPLLYVSSLQDSPHLGSQYLYCDFSHRTPHHTLYDEYRGYHELPPRLHCHSLNQCGYTSSGKRGSSIKIVA